MKKYKPLSDQPDDGEYLRAILRAPIYEILKITPLQKMEKASLQLKNIILAKREDQQIVHSFKIRGAYNMINSLHIQKKLKCIITASAGNHAQGVALSANKLKIKSIVIMPFSTSKIKIEGVKKWGSKIILFGNNFDESKEKAIKLAKEKKYTFIPPFDHPEIIAGQGTIAMELLQQDAHIDKIFVPVGGGGLAAGIAIFIKQLIPQIKIIGVEFNDSACLKAALKANHPTNLSYVNLFAEGVAVKKIGNETFRICKKNLDDVITVDTDAICTAIKDLFEDIRAIAEPSGALALAGMKKYIKKYKIKNERLVHILSGANFNFHSLRYILERCELGEQREALFAVTVSEQEGSFLNLCQILKKHIVTECNYRYTEFENAHIFIGLQISNINERVKIISLLSSFGYNALDLSENEIAKLHIRHMIGGKIKKHIHEELYTFVFPEFQGALLSFLKTFGNHWNITLFHYRHYGTDYGRVLIGFEIKENKKKFEKDLNQLGYRFENVTLNPVFNFFL